MVDWQYEWLLTTVDVGSNPAVCGKRDNMVECKHDSMNFHSKLSHLWNFITKKSFGR